MLAPMQVEVGKPVTFSGYADDYGKQIVAVQFSLERSVNADGDASPLADSAEFTAV